MDWIAAAVVFVCLVVLVADLSRRWGRPRLYANLRHPVTYGVAAVIVAAVVIVNVVD